MRTMSSSRRPTHRCTPTSPTARTVSKVLQLTSPESQPKFYGFSPDPKPQMIAWYPTKNAALSLSRGLERDRAVDESGNQIAIFGRIGSRPFHLDEMQQLYLRKDGTPWFVDDNGWRERRTATDEQKPAKVDAHGAGSH